MKGSAAGRFVLGAGAVALATAALLALVATPYGDQARMWVLFGWSVMASTGVAGGAWLVARHGSLGPGFLLALGACMLARLFASAAVAVAAVSSGETAVWAFLAGLGGTYLPMQLFEVAWIVRKTYGASAAGLH